MRKITRNARRHPHSPARDVGVSQGSRPQRPRRPRACTAAGPGRPARNSAASVGPRPSADTSFSTGKCAGACLQASQIGKATASVFRGPLNYRHVYYFDLFRRAFEEVSEIHTAMY